MKAISIRPPWATYIASGRKTIETRTWETKYRGPLLICAGMSIDWSAPGATGLASNCARGVAVAIAELYAIQTMNEVHEEAAMVNARPGLFAWYLRDIQKIRPFPVKGKLGLFDVRGFRSCTCRGSCGGQASLGERWLCASKWGKAIEAEAFLPAGKTCGSCVHLKRCEGLFGCLEKSERCDWNPSRYAEATP